MPNFEIEEFGNVIVKLVRDATIQSSKMRAHVDAQHVIARRWRQSVESGDLQSIVNVLASDIVDDALFHLLHAIDQGVLQISFTASNGKTISLPTEGMGELAGWYMGSGGWRAMYSGERFVDDFSDLR